MKNDQPKPKASSTRRQQDKEIVRGKILDAARELMVSVGYEGVSTRAIGRKIGYSPMAIYGHFADMDSLLRELCSLDFNAFRESMQRLAVVDDPVERIREMGMAYVRFGLENPGQYRLLFLAPVPPELSDHAYKSGDPNEDMYAFLRSTVAEAVAAGRFREGLEDVDAIAQVFWATTHGTVALHLSHGHEHKIPWCPVMERAQLAVETVLKGFLR